MSECRRATRRTGDGLRCGDRAPSAKGRVVVCGGPAGDKDEMWQKERENAMAKQKRWPPPPPPPDVPIERGAGGKTYKGHYSVSREENKVTAYLGGRSKFADIDRSDPDALAGILFAELIQAQRQRETKKE
jgi:hypothetical protein